MRTQVSLTRLPQRVVLMGTVFTVTSYNPADGSVLVDMERGFVEGGVRDHHYLHDPLRTNLRAALSLFPGGDRA